MFDANMRHLKKGKLFFTKVHSCSEGCEAYDNGVRSGMIIACKMLSDEHENPAVMFSFDGKDIELDHKNGLIDSWFVYEGNQDGTGFICDESRRIAMLED